MVHRMPWRLARRQGRPLNPKHLSICDIRLSLIGLVLEDLGLGTNPQQVGKTIHMVPMPMSEQGLVDGGFFLGEHRLQVSGPCGLALACVDEDALVAAADQVSVGSCCGEWVH